MATKALGVLAHIAALRAWFWRRDQPGEHTLVATNRGLHSIHQFWGVVGGVAHGRHPHSPIELGDVETPITGGLRTRAEV